MFHKEFFTDYIRIFTEENHKINLISQNDEKYLWEKHICDSLSLKLFFDKYGLPDNMLDIGTGGGFPSVVTALAYPDIEITAVDSIAKKIRAVQVLKDKLQLKNLIPICLRVENLDKNYDFITSRAVASLDKISEYALPLLNNKGYFVAFKSRKVQDEIKEAKPILKKYKAKVVDIIEYELPLEEKITRNLVVIQK